MIKNIHRYAILDSACTFIESTGLDGFRMDHFIPVSGFSRRTVYRYFKGKREVLLALMTRGFKKMLTEFELSIGTGSTGFNQLERLFDAYLVFTAKEPLYARLINLFENVPEDLNSCDPEIQDSYAAGDQCIGILIKAVQTGIQDGSVTVEGSAEGVGIALWGLVSGLSMLLNVKQDYLSGTFGLDPLEIQKTAQTLLMRSLQPK